MNVREWLSRLFMVFDVNRFSELAILFLKWTTQLLEHSRKAPHGGTVGILWVGFCFLVPFFEFTRHSLLAMEFSELTIQVFLNR